MLKNEIDLQTRMSIRQEKISNLLKQELALIFQKESRNLFRGRFITVTIVKVSSDLGLAKVYLSFLAVPDKKEELEHVKSQKHEIKKILGSSLGKHLRRIPDLAFFIDDSLDYYQEIDDLLKK